MTLLSHLLSTKLGCSNVTKMQTDSSHLMVVGVCCTAGRLCSTHTLRDPESFHLVALPSCILELVSMVTTKPSPSQQSWGPEHQGSIQCHLHHFHSILLRRAWGPGHAYHKA